LLNFAKENRINVIYTPLALTYLIWLCTTTAMRGRTALSARACIYNSEESELMRWRALYAILFSGKVWHKTANFHRRVARAAGQKISLCRRAFRRRWFIPML